MKRLYNRQVENLKRRLGQKWVSRWTENPKGRSRQKLGIKAHDYVPLSCYLPIRRRFVHQQLSVPHRPSSPTSETRARMSCPKRSNYSVHQGTKVSSAEEHNQYILIPQRVRQQISALSPSKAINSLEEVGYPPADLNIPQHDIRAFLTSIPGNLDLRLFLGGLSDIQWSHFPNTVQDFPRRAQSEDFPRKAESSPQQEAYPQ